MLNGNPCVGTSPLGSYFAHTWWRSSSVWRVGDKSMTCGGPRLRGTSTKASGPITPSRPLKASFQGGLRAADTRTAAKPSPVLTPRITGKLSALNQMSPNSRFSDVSAKSLAALPTWSWSMCLMTAGSIRRRP